MLKLNEKRREKLLNELKIACTNQPELSQEEIYLIRSTIDIADIRNASEEIKENVAEISKEEIGKSHQVPLEVQSNTSECFSEVERKLKDESITCKSSLNSNKISTSFSSLRHYSSPHDSMTVNFFRSSFDEESFYQLEANFIESVTTEMRKASTEINESTPKNTHDVASSGLSTKIRELLRGSKASSFIDDVSSPQPVSSRASDANLSLIPEIPFIEATESYDDNSHKTLSIETLQVSHKNHDAAPCIITRNSSTTSHTSLRRASTFMTGRDIFEKTMAARRKKLAATDSNVDGKVKSSSWSGSESNLNESIKHVYNFDE